MLCYFRKVLQDVLKIENNNELHLLDEEKLNELKDALHGFTTTREELFHLAKNESEKKMNKMTTQIRKYLLLHLGLISIEKR